MNDNENIVSKNKNIKKEEAFRVSQRLRRTNKTIYKYELKNAYDNNNLCNVFLPWRRLNEERLETIIENIILCQSTILIESIVVEMLWIIAVEMSKISEFRHKIKFRFYFVF